MFVPVITGWSNWCNDPDRDHIPVEHKNNSIASRRDEMLARQDAKWEDSQAGCVDMASLRDAIEYFLLFYRYMIPIGIINCLGPLLNVPNTYVFQTSKV